MENLAGKGILTLAIGKKFRKQAKYLAYSCILHSPTLPRGIITDNCEYFKELYDVIIQYTTDMGDPFKVKLKLQHLSPFFETLFVDSDTLVYTDVRFLWDYFDNQSIVYNGNILKEGNWYFKEIGNVLKYYNIPWIGQLNSGVFLFRKDEIGIAVLNYSEELHENYIVGGWGVDIEIPYFREKMLPDEPFLAIAFGKYNQLPTNDFGRLGYSLINTKNVKLDIIKGISKFVKGGKLVFPAIVHFCSDRKDYYLEEKMKLLFYYKSILGGSMYYCPVYVISKLLVFINLIKKSVKYLYKLFKNMK